jgi:hypothetical protein
LGLSAVFPCAVKVAVTTLPGGMLPSARLAGPVSCSAPRAVAVTTTPGIAPSPLLRTATV